MADPVKQHISLYLSSVCDNKTDTTVSEEHFIHNCSTRAHLITAPSAFTQEMIQQCNCLQQRYREVNLATGRERFFMKDLLGYHLRCSHGVTHKDWCCVFARGDLSGVVMCFLVSFHAPRTLES